MTNAIKRATNETLPENLVRRALAAYLKAGHPLYTRNGEMINFSGSSMTERDGLDYVTIYADGHGVLAVYRVRTSGQLKELKRWP